MPKTLALLIAMAATPATAQNELQLWCSGGRTVERNYEKTNRPLRDPNLSITIKSDKKTLVYSSPSTMPSPAMLIDRLDEQAIWAVEPISKGVIKVSIDRLRGTLEMETLLYLPPDVSGSGETKTLYDCSNTPPKPRF